MRWDGRDVAGVSRVSALSHTHADPVVLERGVTHDVEFQRWILGFHASPSSTRATIEIAVLDERSDVALTYVLRGCWPSEFAAFPDLDANRTAVTFENLVLQCESFERVPNPSRPR